MVSLERMHIVMILWNAFSLWQLYYLGTFLIFLHAYLFMWMKMSVDALAKDTIKVCSLHRIFFFIWNPLRLLYIDYAAYYEPVH